MSLGCVLSVKWIGLFAIALVGVFTIEELWTMLGDLNLPLVIYFFLIMIEILCHALGC
jgi:dolichyl-phosphate-mannose-protein mannosyltransferase